MSDKYENDRFTKHCCTCGQKFYKAAFEAAKEFLDTCMINPEIKGESREKYLTYLAEVEKLNNLQNPNPHNNGDS